MKRLLIISHALIVNTYQKRWRMMAENYPIKIRVLVPEEWHPGRMDHGNILYAKYEKKRRFELMPVKTTSKHSWWSYSIIGLRKQLKDFKPDVIYCIHEEGIFQLIQSILIRDIFFPQIKIVYFSMRVFPRVPTVNLKSLKSIYSHLRMSIHWSFIKRRTSGVLCHYPGIQNQLLKDGYTKPIAIQTQVGVFESFFKKDKKNRKKIREEMSLNGFVIGFVGRICEEKGIFDLLKSLEQIIDLDWMLLLVGDGDDKKMVRKWANINNVADRIVFTGFVQHSEVPGYMRAMDCLVAMSKTTVSWIDTFPLVVVQAMMVGTPVIGSSSGALPFQLGAKGLIVSEGDTQKLSETITELYKDSNKINQYSEYCHNRAKALFSLSSMNNNFVKFINSHCTNCSIN